MSQINSFRDLIVYQKAYDVSKEIFEIFKPESTPLRAYLLYIIRNSLINAGHSVENIVETGDAFCRRRVPFCFSAKQSREKKAIH